MKFNRIADKLSNVNISIKAKLTVMITILFFLITTVMFNIMFSHAKNKALETTRENAADLSRMTAFGIRAALDFRLEEEILSVFQLSAQNEEVIYLVVTDNSDEVIAAHNLDTAKILQYDRMNLNSESFIGDSVIFIKTPVNFENKQIGQLYLGYSLISTNLQLGEVQLGVLATSLVFIFLGFLGSLAIGRIIATPINKLVKSFERVSEGDLKERAEVKSSDELGKLSESFNAMVESLEFAVSELATSNTLIRESEQLYKELVAKLPDFVILHRNQKIFLVNDAIKEVMGYDNEEVLGKNIFDFIAPESYEIVAEKNRLRLDGHEVEPFEIELITKHGTKITGEIRGSQIFYQRELAVLNVIVNVTERKKYELRLKEMNNILEQKIAERTIELSDAINKLQSEIQERIRTEEKLKESEERALESSRLKSEFVANMSHEIRTPLNAILGFTSLLAINVDDPRLNQYIDSIKAGGKNLLTLINDILDLSKIEAGRLDLNPEPVDLRSFIEEIKNIFASKIQEKLIDFRLRISEDVPPTLILDEVRIRQILFNLIGNAVKFTEKGAISLEVDNLFTAGDRSKVDLIISVTDTGIGIPHEYQTVIFDSFKQHYNQTQRRYGGTGLGLAITKRLVEMMEGSISVESKFGEGSKFTVIIKNVSASSVKRKQDELTNVNKPFFTFKNKKILIVDDVSTNCEMLAELFKPTDSEIIFASNGIEAIEKTNEYFPDMIIMDIRMPRLDGNKAAQIIKSDPATSSIPIVAITASALKEDLEPEYLQYFAGYIIKPVDIFYLIGLSNKLIGVELESDLSEETGTTRSDSELKFTEKVSVEDFNAVIAMNVYPYHEKAVKTKLLSDVISFAEEIMVLYKFCGAKVLENFSDELKFAANSFDIETINKCLDIFPVILEDIKQKNQSLPEDI